MKKGISMDSLKIPEDLDKNNELRNHTAGKSFGVPTGHISNSVNLMGKRNNFDSVSEDYDGMDKVIEDKRAEEEEKEKAKKDFIPVPQSNIPRAKGVHIGKKFFTTGKLVKICIAIVLLIALMLFFLPPIGSNVVENHRVDTESNIFENGGITQLKLDYANDYSMYNENALSSEKAENYREVYFTFSMRNMSILQVEIPQYEIYMINSDSADHVVYAGSANPTANDVIQPFSTQQIVIKVLINTVDLNDEQFHDLVTGLSFKTVGMKKKVSSTTYCPCLPAIMFVSNTTALYMD